MKKQKKLKKFNKPTKLTKRAAGMSAKAVKKPQIKAAPAKSVKSAPKGKTAKAASKALPKGKVAPQKAKAIVKTPVKGAKPQMVAAVLGKAKIPVPAPSAPLVKAAPVAKTTAAKKGKPGKASLSFGDPGYEKMCRENACENAATTKGYCRLDYIKNWKKIKRKEMILKEGKLNQYIEELVGKYPDKYIDVIRQDLSSEVNFNKVIHDLELDESIDDLEYDGDSIDALIGGIRKEDGGFDDGEF